LENSIAFPSTIFKPRISRELLAPFFTNPAARYYVRQLRRSRLFPSAACTMS